MADTEVKIVEENNGNDVSDEPIAKKQKLDASVESAVEAEHDVSQGDKAADATDLQKEIIDQVEYYFGDSNLYRDKFMQAELEKKEGWVCCFCYRCCNSTINANVYMCVCNLDLFMMCIWTE